MCKWGAFIEDRNRIILDSVCAHVCVCVGVHLCKREQDKSDETERDSKK